MGLCCSPAQAQAQADGESFRIHGTAAAARAVSGHQQVELDFGGATYAAVEWGPAATWGLQLEGGFIGLVGNDVVPPSGLEPLDGATGGQLGAGVRVRPFAPATAPLDVGGLWASAAFGASFTGDLVAPQFDAFLGYDAYLSRQFGFGPTVGYAHIFQSDEAIRPDDATIVLFGVHAVFDFYDEPLDRGPTDTDGDGIFDAQDQCPQVPEDADGFEDQDGCPDRDNDEDGILDHEDECPLDPEDVDTFEDDDGCPDPDNDADGIPDESDQCPLEPEDRDGWEDEDGCPDLDNDGDGFEDKDDLCPNEPEVVNGYSDDDGCPDSKSVRVKGDKIELAEKIHFWTDSSTIRAMSYPVLSKLAVFLEEHPEYVHVSVEGHADERGPEDLNQKLSESRASAVREFLIERGVDSDRLSSKGFGESRPLVDKSNERAWFLNRRVEFVVTREKEVVVTENEAPGAGEDATDDKKPEESEESREDVPVEEVLDEPVDAPPPPPSEDPRPKEAPPEEGADEGAPPSQE